MTDEVTRFNTRHENQERFISISEYTQSLLDRIVELTKENEQLKCDLYNTEANLQSMTINCENLEKENTELKAKLNGALDICSIPECRINELKKENTELKAQIEMQKETIKESCDFLNKLRCCGNCANRIDGQEFKDGCKENWDCENYSKWRFDK